MSRLCRENREGDLENCQDRNLEMARSRILMLKAFAVA